MAFVPRIKKFLPKAELEHGVHYLGSCRNAEIARWNAADNRFYYTRRKFDLTYVESIPHPDDFNGFDVFYPQRVQRPAPGEEVKFPDNSSGE